MLSSVNAPALLNECPPLSDPATSAEATTLTHNKTNSAPPAANTPLSCPPRDSSADWAIKLSELRSVRLVGGPYGTGSLVSGQSDSSLSRVVPSASEASSRSRHFGGSGYVEMDHGHGPVGAGFRHEPISGENDISDQDLQAAPESTLLEAAKLASQEAKVECKAFIASYDVKDVTVFRGDGRHPNDVFASGFIRRDKITPGEIAARNPEGIKGVGFRGSVSTSTSAAIAQGYAHFNTNGYLYAIQLEAGKKVQTSVGDRTLGEVASAYIAPDEIMFAVGPVINPFQPRIADRRFEGPQLLINPYAKASEQVAQAAFEQIQQLGILDSEGESLLEPRFTPEPGKTSELSPPLEAQIAMTLEERMPFVQRYQQRKDVLLDPSEINP
jgi:hypothetical protein